MDYAIMFKALAGGVVEPVKWGKESFTPDTSVIILDEGSMSIYIWHGLQQGLVARRTAIRQADALKGHGYTVGMSIVGRDIKTIKEIEQRKIGKDKTTDELNEELQAILENNFTELEDFIITFGEEVDQKELALLKQTSKPKATKAKPAAKTKSATKLKPKTTAKPAVKKKPAVKAESKSISKELPKEEALKLTETTVNSLIEISRAVEEYGGIHKLIGAIEDLEKIATLPHTSSSEFIDDVKKMKNAIKNSDSVPKSIKYSTREDFVKEEMDKLSKGK